MCGEGGHFFVVGLGRIQIGLCQTGVRFVFRRRQIDLSLGHLYLGLGHCLAGIGVIQTGQHVARLHLVTDLHRCLGQHTTGLESQLQLRRRQEVAAAIRREDDVAPVHRRRLQRWLLWLFSQRRGKIARVGHITAPGCQKQHDD